MEEQLVLFETAKLAKEKGFNEYGLLWLDYDSTGKFINNTYMNGKSECICCTQSLLQKWLREVHGLFVLTLPDYKGLWGYSIMQKDHYHTQGNRFELDEIVGTFEQALEEGLQEALKLIK